MSTQNANPQGSMERMSRAFRWCGLWRMRWDTCPACNSDAPEVDTCRICDGYDSRATWSEYPPEKNRKALWRRRWAAECSNTELAHDDEQPATTPRT